MRGRKMGKERRRSGVAVHGADACWAGASATTRETHALLTFLSFIFLPLIFLPSAGAPGQAWSFSLSERSQPHNCSFDVKSTSGDQGNLARRSLGRRSDEPQRKRIQFGLVTQFMVATSLPVEVKSVTAALTTNMNTRRAIRGVREQRVTTERPRNLGDPLPWGGLVAVTKPAPTPAVNA